MISYSGLCFFLVLALTFAADQAKVDKLMNEITSKVVDEMIKVANDSQGVDTKELDTKLLSTAKQFLEKLEPQIIELSKLSGLSKDQLAKDLTEKINESQALKEAVSSRGKHTSQRFASALIMGIAQIVVEIVKLALDKKH